MVGVFYRVFALFRRRPTSLDFKHHKEMVRTYLRRHAYFAILWNQTKSVKRDIVPPSYCLVGVLFLFCDGGANARLREE